MASPDARATLPASGPLTFLFTDIEGSTRKAHDLGDDWFGVLQAHHDILRPVFAAHGGHEVSTAGDSFFVVFPDAQRAIAATVAMQRAISAHDWSPHPTVKVRMGLHTGLARFRAADNDYAGLTVHAASRVESAAAGGQVLITQATLDAAGELPDGVTLIDLGPHRLKDLPSDLQLFQLVAEGLEREFPPVRGLDVARNNVPTPASSFIGRGEVLARLHNLLDDDRLVTIVGPGGTGKTRVALRLASERLHRHVNGVWFVELDGATNEATVVAAVAQALGVRERRDQTLVDAVADHVSGADILLVVDNCEHVIDDAARVVERLLRQGPKVRVVATSREPLEIPGERMWPLAPLTVDEDDPASGEAVQLLADRVERVRPGFVMAGDDLDAAALIARRLDGLPLAIELAAASAVTLSLPEIAQQLDDRFAVLTRGSRTALDRQKTLWGAIDWSYSLLSAAQQLAFRRLGVFPGEFDFALAKGVSGEGTAHFDDELSALIRKSLVVEAPSTRLRMLESIKAYARERLADDGELDGLAERHARYVVEQFDEDVNSDQEWVDTLNEDLLAALYWGRDNDAEVALRALAELQPFWHRKGRWTEGRAVSEEVLADTTDVRSKTRWRALGNTAQLVLALGQTTEARRLFEEAGDVAAEVGGAEQAQLVLGDLGAIAAREGDFVGAEELYERALAAARSLGDKAAIALSLSHLSQLAGDRGDLTRAWNLGLEALEKARELDWEELAFALTTLTGVYALRRGEYGEARRVFDDALAGARKLDYVEPVPNLLFYIASIDLIEGDLSGAATRLHEALTLSLRLESEDDLVENTEATARLAHLAGDHALGCRLLASGEATRKRIGFAREPAGVAAYDSLVAELGSECDAFDDEWSEGAQLTPTNAAAVALEFLDRLRPTAP